MIWEANEALALSANLVVKGEESRPTPRRVHHPPAENTSELVATDINSAGNCENTPSSDAAGSVTIRDDGFRPGYGRESSRYLRHRPFERFSLAHNARFYYAWGGLLPMLILNH